MKALQFYVPNSEIKKFEKGISVLHDTREGVVMDSYIGVRKSGVYFVALDTYETAWTSGLTVTLSNNYDDVLTIWEKFTEDYDTNA